MSTDLSDAGSVPQKCQTCGVTVTGWHRDVSEYVDALGRVYSTLGLAYYEPCGHPA